MRKKVLSIALCVLMLTACMAGAGMAEEKALNTLYSSEILPKIKRLKELKAQRFTLDEIRAKMREE